MSDILQLIAERVASGLRRTTLTVPSKWSEAYRMMSEPFPGKWTFKYHPWLREMHDSKADFNIGRKSSQMGFTEWALNITFFKIDVEGVNCLYILPTEDDASTFSAGRFDPALESSPHLQNLFSNVKNVGHKRAGQYNLYVRGSRSRSELKSIPCGFIVFDEVDEMLQKNIPLALERAAGQLRMQVLMISTPTIPEKGIDAYYKDSTQEHFFFKCPHCSKLTELIYPDCLVITAETTTDPRIKESYFQCKECHGVLEHEKKPEFLANGLFVPEYSNRDIRGFTVNHLYSSALYGKPEILALASLKADLDPTEATELYNSKLGQPYIAKGAKVTDTDIDACIKQYRQGPHRQSRIVTMGVDVGSMLHVVIHEWELPKQRTPGIEINDEARPRLLMEQSFRAFEDLDILMRDYRVLACVVDRQPETRAAYQFATRFWGRVLLCIYGRGINGKQVHLGSEEERTITVDRTSWLDLTLGRYRNHTISLPIDISEEFKKHIKEMTRHYIKDADGNPVGRYINIGPDHFAHASNYSELALPLAVNISANHDITGIY